MDKKSSGSRQQTGAQDLVALVSNSSEVGDGADLSLQLIVFLTSGISEPTFGTPTVSKMKIPSIGFKVLHMQFLDAHQVAWRRTGHGELWHYAVVQ